MKRKLKIERKKTWMNVSDWASKCSEVCVAKTHHKTNNQTEYSCEFKYVLDRIKCKRYVVMLKKLNNM